MVSYCCQHQVSPSKGCLNPYCSGQWPRTHASNSLLSLHLVLILVVVDNGLVLVPSLCILVDSWVLILIVMDNGLIRILLQQYISSLSSLNPYCNGQWSHTRPYKTILIISKLKNLTKETFTFLNRKLTIS